MLPTFIHQTYFMLSGSRMETAQSRLASSGRAADKTHLDTGAPWSKEKKREKHFVSKKYFKSHICCFYMSAKLIKHVAMHALVHYDTQTSEQTVAI